MTHIFKCIQRRQRPQKGNQTDKYTPQSVQPERKIQITGQMKENKSILRTPKHTENRKRGGHQHQNFQKEIPPLLRQMKKGHYRPSQNREHHRKDQIYTAHTLPPSTKALQQLSAESLKMTLETFRTVQPLP